jgi:hypothetical protein
VLEAGRHSCFDDFAGVFFEDDDFDFDLDDFDFEAFALGDFFDFDFELFDFELFEDAADSEPWSFGALFSAARAALGTRRAMARGMIWKSFIGFLFALESARGDWRTETSFGGLGLQPR